jgi:hypothetical protein
MAKTATANQQIASLKGLTQKAAAYLLGKSARWLRDRVDAPVNPDTSTYDGAELFRWAAALGADSAPGDFADDVHEKLLIIADVIRRSPKMVSEIPDAATRRTLQTLSNRHGVGVKLALVEILMDGLADEGVEYFCGSIEDALDSVRSDRADMEAAAKLDIRFQCRDCDLVRLGRTWTKMRPSATCCIVQMHCPTCEVKA